MNSNSLSKLLMPLLLMVAATFICFDLMSSTRNVVGRLYFYAMCGAGIFGLLNPRTAFYFLLFLTFYLDFFKRMLIFDSGVSSMDLYYVLGIAPVTMAGIVGNLGYRYLLGTNEFPPRVGRILLAVVVVTGSLFAALIAGGRGFRAVGDAVNAVCYIFLIPVIPMLFPTPDAIRGMLKTILILAVPSAIYMACHYFRGELFDWEMVYVKSGLTMEIRQLGELSFRPFGTLNSAANASTVFGFMVTLIAGGFWNYRYSNHPKGRGIAVWAVLGIPLFGLAAYATLSRMGWFTAILGIFAARLVRNRVGTLVTYAVALAFVVMALVATPYLLKTKLLNEISGVLIGKGGAERSQAVNISTLNDRLEGYYEVLTNPRAWTPFGLRLANRTQSEIDNMRSHDVLSSALYKLGYIPLALSIVVLCYITFKFHSLVFRIQSRQIKVAASATLGLALAQISGTSINGAQMVTFPVNVYIYLFLGSTLALAWYDKDHFVKAEQEPVEANPRLPVVRPRQRLATAGSSV